MYTELRRGEIGKPASHQSRWNLKTAKRAIDLLRRPVDGSSPSGATKDPCGHDDEDAIRDGEFAAQERFERWERLQERD